MTKLRIIFTLFAIVFFVACSDSVTSWKNEVVKEKGERGWLLLLEQFGGKRLAFVNIYSTEKIRDGVFYVKVLWAIHPSTGGSYREEVFPFVEDCTNHRSAIIDDSIPVKEIDLSGLQWRNIKDDQLHPILCSSLNKL